MALKHLVAASLLLPAVGWTACSGTDAHCNEWRTSETYPGGQVVLHWAHVYERRDTVYLIEFPAMHNQPRSVKVEGQPVFNARKTVVALPYCADDGCKPEIQVVDLLARGSKRTITLPYTGQFYVTATWNGATLLVSVERSEGGHSSRRQHAYRLSTLVKEHN